MDNRFLHIKRGYSPSDIEHLKPKHQQTPANTQIALNFYQSLRKAFKERKSLISFGVLDPIQLVEASPYLDVIYVSGWQSSSTCSTNNLPGPDIADYPYTTVPNKVDQLFRAQQLHDVRLRIDNNQEDSPIYRPIIADADTGHGGNTSVMKMVKMFIEAGASGIHLEDQKHGAKKCGHMGGKVLVSVAEHVQRLKAARLQADLMNHPLVIVARTDAEAAKLLDNNKDERDQEFILGEARYGGNNLGEKTIPELAQWLEENTSLSVGKMKNLKDLKDFQVNCSGVALDMESLRTSEGYYKVKCGIEFSAMRSLVYSEYADIIWMETAKPVLQDAKVFAEIIHAKSPETMLAYNLSPSFNWDMAFESDQDIKDFMTDLSKYGYVWEFITLAGFHQNGLAVHKFAKNFKEDGMLAYVRDIQREERKAGISLLTHQKWSGSYVVDETVGLIAEDKSTNIMTDDNTEKDF